MANMYMDGRLDCREGFEFDLQFLVTLRRNEIEYRKVAVLAAAMVNPDGFRNDQLEKLCDLIIGCEPGRKEAEMAALMDALHKWRSSAIRFSPVDGANNANQDQDINIAF